MSEQTSTYAPGCGGSFAGVAAILALVIALLICLPAQAQMAGPPATSRTMPGQMANPMMTPNSNMMPNNGTGMGGNMNGGMGNNAGGMNGNMGGTMMNPANGMRMPYMQRMPNPGGTAAPSSGRRLTPSFVGMTRNEASALAEQYGLVAAFDGATSEDARVAGQAPEAGVLIFRAAMPIRFQMEAPASRPPSQTAAAAPEPQAASPPPAQQTPTAAPTASPPTTPAAAPAKPAPARSVAPPPAAPIAPSHNWWTLLAIAVALAGTIWALFGRRWKPDPARFNSPLADGMAQLATQIVSSGLAEASVSLGGASAPRFELCYVVEHGEQPDQIGISVGGGKNGG
jgi:hypothetical protein